MKTDIHLIQSKSSELKVEIKKHLPLMPWNKQYDIFYNGNNDDVILFFLVVRVGDVIGVDDFYMKVTHKSGLTIKGDKIK